MNNVNHSRRRLLAGAAATLATATVAGLPNTASAKPDLFSGINRVKNPGAKSGLEKKHAPVIEAPASARAGETVTVRVSVGSSPHPMTDKHWIENIRVFSADGKPLADVDFGRTGVAPEVTLRVPVAAATTLVAQATCNLHGIWESRHNIAV